jgi:methylated-DNA-protein-cysteine methyltransferase-like protein
MQVPCSYDSRVGERAGAAFERRVRDVVRSIPAGRVASYGLVAIVAGRPGASRAVGRVMHDCDDPGVPCHRVVHADGSLVPHFTAQRPRLVRERVVFRGDRVDMRRSLWLPRLGGLQRSRRMMRKDSPAA